MQGGSAGRGSVGNCFCAICLQECWLADTACLSCCYEGCAAVYHAECAARALSQARTCPACRRTDVHPVNPLGFLMDEVRRLRMQSSADLIGSGIATRVQEGVARLQERVDGKLSEQESRHSETISSMRSSWREELHSAKEEMDERGASRSAEFVSRLEAERDARATGFLTLRKSIHDLGALTHSALLQHDKALAEMVPPKPREALTVTICPS